MVKKIIKKFSSNNSINDISNRGLNVEKKTNGRQKNPRRPKEGK